MKNSKIILSALALTSANLLAPSAFAGTVASANENITLVDNQATIEHLITGGNKGLNFSDRYNFTTSSAGDLYATLYPRANSDKSAQAITGFSLFDSSGKFVASSSNGFAGDGGWLIDFDNLAAGTYYLQVNGSLASNAALKYLANLSIGPQGAAAIPEPASAAMLLGGLGLLGVMARRRQTKAKQAV